MKNKNFVLLLFSIVPMFTGCALFQKVGNMGYNEPFEFSSSKVRKHSYLTKDFRKDYDGAKDQGAAGEPTARRERDQILGELMFIIDSDHGKFERSLRGGKTSFDLFSDFALLGLTGAAAVTGGAETKAILAAIATGVKGAELSVNKRVFQDQAIEAIQAQMRSAQLLRKSQIIQSMAKPTTKYTLDMGLSDIVQYFYDGTLARAFQNLVADAKKKEGQAEDKVSEAKNIKPVSAP